MRKPRAMHGLRFMPFALLALTGCNVPDYTPVRDWAATASLAVDYPRVAGTPEADAGILAMQQALVTYLQAIATLASDGVLPYRESPFVELAASARRISEPGGQAIASLGLLLRYATRSNAQAPDLRANIVAADPQVQALITALRSATANGAGQDAAARSDAAAEFTRLEAETRDPAARQAIRELARQRDIELAARQAARVQYEYILVRIAAGHAMLKARASTITQEEAVQQIRAAEDQLRRNAASLPRGWPE